MAHLLNGDCLAEVLSKTTLKGNLFVCRECLIEGDTETLPLESFWTKRASFLEISYAEYHKKTITEFEKLATASEKTEICLWFENDLFCQVNLWFSIWYLSKIQQFTFYRIFPTNEKQAFDGFSKATYSDLELAFDERVKLKNSDIELAQNLWIAYSQNNVQSLKELAQTPTSCFRFLPDVCQVHIERSAPTFRVEAIIKMLISENDNNFYKVFEKFSQQYPIYGFGDLQLKRIYDSVLKNGYDL